MRDYYNDPSHPERRETKRASDRAYYQDNEENLSKNRARARDHYWANRDAKRKYIAVRLRDFKIRAVMLKGGKCERCGWNEHPAGLQFHHRDPSQKEFTITTAVMGSPKKYPWKVIEAEIAKCDLLCANCHFMEESAWELEGIWPVG